MRPYIVAIDFDNTLARNAPWTGKQQPPFPPNPEVVDLARRLHDDGCIIVIWTCRNDDALVAEYCEKYNIPFDGVNVNLHPTFDEGADKIYADVYLDDKGMHYAEIDTSDQMYAEITRRRLEWIEKEGD